MRTPTLRRPDRPRWHVTSFGLSREPRHAVPGAFRCRTPRPIASRSPTSPPDGGRGSASIRRGVPCRSASRSSASCRVRSSRFSAAHRSATRSRSSCGATACACAARTSSASAGRTGACSPMSAPDGASNGARSAWRWSARPTPGRRRSSTRSPVAPRRVGNYPGVTVERREGALLGGEVRRSSTSPAPTRCTARRQTSRS